MPQVLLVCTSKKGVETMSGLLGSDHETIPADGAASARELLGKQNFGIVILDTPLKDGGEAGLACDLSETDCFVIALTGDKTDEKTIQAVTSSGAYIIHKPFRREVFVQAVEIAGVFAGRLGALGDEKKTFYETKISELNLINRAKCTLIHYLGLTEQQAHRFIEKQAMDRRMTRREIAEGILKTYET